MTSSESPVAVCMRIRANSPCRRTITKAVDFLHKAQRPEGPWFGSWGICFTYATQFALESLSLVGETYENSVSARRACDFLIGKQRADGGWGESYKVCHVCPVRQRVSDRHIFSMGSRARCCTGLSTSRHRSCRRAGPRWRSCMRGTRTRSRSRGQSSLSCPDSDRCVLAACGVFGLCWKAYGRSHLHRMARGRKRRSRACSTRMWRSRTRISSSRSPSGCLGGLIGTWRSSGHGRPRELVVQCSGRLVSMLVRLACCTLSMWTIGHALRASASPPQTVLDHALWAWNPMTIYCFRKTLCS